MVSLLDASDINQLATQAFDRKIEPEITNSTSNFSALIPLREILVISIGFVSVMFVS